MRELKGARDEGFKLIRNSKSSEKDLEKIPDS